MSSKLQDDPLRVSRIISVIAATWIAISCGTNYAYSAWAPQFAEQLHLTATQSNIIGNAANIGMYAVGIPVGLVVDNKGPRWATTMGVTCLVCGYFPLWSAYNKGPGQSSFFFLCLASLLTGIGSCSCFSGAIKVCATNWPRHRGTATALPLSAFGLSAFAYTTISGLAFPHDAGHLLLFLAIGTATTITTGMLFLRILPQTPVYKHVSQRDRPASLGRDSNELHRTNSRQGKHSRKPSVLEDPGVHRSDSFETSSLLSSPVDHSDEPTDVDKDPRLHKPDITGWALLRSGAFWKLWVLLGLLCGVGLMTINNIGNDAKTLWHHWDDSASKAFISRRQLMHVGILSICSFVGRLCSGIGSDFLVKSFNSSRYWSLVASALIFTAAQISALRIENPHWLFVLSGLTGLAYGALFGVYPALVADAFGAAGMGINWGAMTMAPVLSGNIFNLIYGANLDAHSDHPEGSERVCLDGRVCYSDAYIVTLFASLAGVGWSLWCVHHERKERKALEKLLDLHQG
ncbi:MFS general substrate transporter [Myriangium duriaei CBS 260.36]|uniref:MFS general substrate transporter n=1 Tax=Myriangium duriaei CBS 260.36 TaxID=1168546 RepID=A0A9P4J4G7_9PEZI|nr:MFS general substrate transporter [Myriangium duriaei CBS 260.36]